MEFAAALYDGESAARHEVSVRVEAGGLQIQPRGELWGWSEIRVRKEAALRIERGAAALVVGSEAMGPVLRALEGRVRVESAQGHAPALLVSLAVAVPLLLWLAYRFLLPWAGEQAARVAPLEWEEKLGETASQSLLAGTRAVGKGAAADAVELVKDRLQRQLPETKYRYRVTLVESAEVNAGALPGGRIFVFSALVRQCGTADEFAAVLAHEMIHVEKRHGMKNMGRQAAVGLLLALLGSPDSLGLTMGTQMAGLKYQRGDEEEADAEGLRLMARAGFEPAAAARFFERLSRGEQAGIRMPEYLSTHPDPAGRAGRLRELARGFGSPPGPAIPAAAWRAALAGLPQTHSSE